MICFSTSTISSKMACEGEGEGDGEGDGDGVTTV
jgi:hypothetical protein